MLESSLVRSRMHSFPWGGPGTWPWFRELFSPSDNTVDLSSSVFPRRQRSMKGGRIFGSSKPNPLNQMQNRCLADEPHCMWEVRRQYEVDFLDDAAINIAVLTVQRKYPNNRWLKSNLVL